MEKLVTKACSGDKDSFVTLINQHRQAMFKVALGILKNEEDVADAIQETILSCYENIGNLREPKYFRTWMTRILINKCNDIIRENKKIQTLEDYEGAISDDNLGNYEFYEILKQIDEKYRNVILLYYVQEFKIREIAGILNMPVPTVKTRLSRGRKQLREIYEKIERKGGA